MNKCMVIFTQSIRLRNIFVRLMSMYIGCYLIRQESEMEIL